MTRARDLGIPLEGTPGTYNAITDVPGVTVGYATLIDGESIRTGVTVIHPRGQRQHEPVFAGTFAFNGNGEITGAAWVEESGMLEGPVAITNTHSVGLVRDTIIDWQVKNNAVYQGWSCPVVTETTDGWLNDINGFHVKPEHVWQALESAAGGMLAEGNVGGGTGMLCYEFKGGTGTSSRKLPEQLGSWTVGALVQSNFGRRYQLTIAGVPVGQHLREHAPFSDGRDPFHQDQGSLIIVLATDAPLLPHQLKRLAKRGSLGMARTGSVGGNGSGDIFLAFSTAGTGITQEPVASIKYLPNDHLDPLFSSAVYATEEAILNSMVGAQTITGRNGTVQALPHDQLIELLKQYNRI